MFLEDYMSCKVNVEYLKKVKLRGFTIHLPRVHPPLLKGYPRMT